MCKMEVFGPNPGVFGRQIMFLLGFVAALRVWVVFLSKFKETKENLCRVSFSVPPGCVFSVFGGVWGVFLAVFGCSVAMKRKTKCGLFCGHKFPMVFRWFGAFQRRAQGLFKHFLMHG